MRRHRCAGNLSPFGGKLQVSPTQGELFNTTFYMLLIGWTDEPEQLPLRYAFEYRVGMGADDCHADSDWVALVDPQASPEHWESALAVRRKPCGKALGPKMLPARI